MFDQVVSFEPLKTFPNGYPVPFMVQRWEVEELLVASLGQSSSIERLIHWHMERPTVVRCTRTGDERAYIFDEFDHQTGEYLGRLYRTVAWLQANEARLAIAYRAYAELDFPSQEQLELHSRLVGERRDA